jgi:tryptophan synthase alpha chain
VFKNSLDFTFARLKAEKKKALITYVAAGYPKFPEETRLLSALDQSGADIIELGIPFSDPIADGPTIQFASQEALKNGASVVKILSWIKSWKVRLRAPLVFMTYMNPVLRYGIEKFARDSSRAGVSGVIIPDMIPEEAGELEKIFHKNKLHLIYLVSPTTPKARQRIIARKTSGFLYAVSVTGVTGARKGFSAATARWIKSLKGLTSHPVCVGFGISGADHIRQLKKSANGFIVGSALIDVIRSNGPRSRETAVRKFISSLAKECHNGR